ncbi:MAG: heat-inducible transcription repressor HrcA [Nitrospirae bacterium]|nr:heat-inducible transcription repressor HrcA [Nitrospirota bacterium]
MIFDMLDKRSKQVLQAVVQSYINNPEPVGSRYITKKYAVGCSPATIRNIMADLEDFGFLSQPHTSAGRVPTDKGYRFFVDSLGAMEESRAQSEMSKEFAQQFMIRLEAIKDDISMLFSEVTNTLSALSNYVSIALPPKPEKTTFNRIQLIKYRRNIIVAILLTDEGVFRNRSLTAPEGVTQDDLDRIADYINTEYAGLTLDEIKKTLVQRIKYEKVLWDKLVNKAIEICEQALYFAEDDVFVSGLYDVMDLPDFSDISHIKELSRAIRDKHMMLKLLEELSDAEGVKVVIGNENPIVNLKGLSVVTTTYKEGERPMGVIALIGPRRMDYSKAISMIDMVAHCVSRTLGG